MNELLENINKLHTTALGINRIKKNLEIKTNDVAAWCKNKTKNADKILRKGKNWYVYADNSIITINAHSYTIITAHKDRTKISESTPLIGAER